MEQFLMWWGLACCGVGKAPESPALYAIDRRAAIDAAVAARASARGRECRLLPRLAAEKEARADKAKGRAEAGVAGEVGR